MDRVGAYEARTHSPRLLDRVGRGESLVITRQGRPVARLVPVRNDDSARYTGGPADRRASPALEAHAARGVDGVDSRKASFLMPSALDRDAGE